MSNPDDCSVAVKPLVWESQNVEGTFVMGVAPMSGEYRVKFNGKKWEAICGMLLIASLDSRDKAKAAAQADFEQRIRSALVPVAAPVAAGSDEVVEVKPGLRDRLSSLAKWLTERSYFNEAKDIYGVLHFIKTAETTITADKAEIARLDGEFHRRGVKIIEMTEQAGAYLCRAEASESRCAAVMAERDGLAKALKTIAFMRPLGPTRNKMVEKMERVAIDALDARAALEAQEPVP